MGNEQSNDNRNNRQPQPRQMTEAQLQRLLDAQRQQYERKLEEVAAKAAAQRKQEEAARVAAQKKQEDAARATAQRVQEEAARATAQIYMPQTSTGVSSFNFERERAPYSFPGNQLQQAAAPSAPPAPQPVPNVYPNLNQAPMNPNYNYNMNNSNNNNNSPFRPVHQYKDFVLVNSFGQTESYNNRPMPAYSNPSGPGPAPRAPAPYRGGNRGRGQRPRSESRNRNSPRERDALDCPTCNSRYGMRIFSCDEGHSSCNECKIRGRACGLCGRTITDRRNFDIENLIAKTKAPCPHANEGCKLSIEIANMENHIKECPFKEQNCPLNAIFGTCHWKGKLSQLSNHFDTAHPSGRQTNVDTEIKLTNVHNNSQAVYLVCLGVYNFLVHEKVSQTDGKIYMAVQLIGTKFSAMKWVYEIHIYNKSENRRKYTYTDNCCSSNDKIDDVFEAGNCAVLPVWHANTFVCDGALTYKFFIKKTNEENKGFNKNNRGRGKNQK